MTSTIGVGAQPVKPSFNFIEHPNQSLRGSTSGIGGQSTESHGRYDPEPTHNFKYMPGSHRFWKVYRARYMGPLGTWGQAHLRKYNPVKQIGGSSGYLSQYPSMKRSADFKVMANIGRMPKNPFIPRSGAVPRVVGREMGDLGEGPADNGVIPRNLQETFGGSTVPGTGNNEQKPVKAPITAPPTIMTPATDLMDWDGPLFTPTTSRGSDMSRRNSQFTQVGGKTLEVSDKPTISAPEDEKFYDARQYPQIYPDIDEEDVYKQFLFGELDGFDGKKVS